MEGQKLEKKTQNESRIILVHGGPVCTNSWNIMFSALAVLILQASDKRRVPWPTKLLRLVLRQWKSIMALKFMLTLPGSIRGLTDLVCNHNGKETIVDFKQSNRPKKRRMDRRLLLTDCHVRNGPRLRLRQQD